MEQIYGMSVIGFVGKKPYCFMRKAIIMDINTYPCEKEEHFSIVIIEIIYF